MHKIFATAILGAMLAAAQTQTQTQPTAAELLQKGIYAQETAGDLDGAIKIYRQIVDSHPTQREIGAQAQYRLGLTLLAKGDAANASQEIQRLGWDFPDYKDLIASARTAGGTPLHITFSSGPLTVEQRQALEREKAAGTNPQRVATYSFLANQALSTGDAAAQDLAKLVTQHDSEYDFSRSVTVTGTIKQVQLVNPYSWLLVNPNGDTTRTLSVSLDSPNALYHAGWDKAMPHTGEQITITGAPAIDGTSFIQATSVSQSGTVIFTRSPVAAK